MTQTGEQTPRAPLLKPPPHRPSPYERFVRIGIVAWCGIGVIILGYLMLRLMLYVNPVLPPLLIAVAVVYLLNPLVSALERRGVPRVAGAGIVYVLFLCIVALVVSLLVPLVTRQVGQVIDHFPDYLADAQAWVRRVAARFGQEPNFHLDADQVRQWLTAEDNRQTVTRYLTGLRSVTTSLLSGLIIFVIGPVMAFYLLVDLPRLQRGAMALIPPGRREEIRGLMERIGQAVGGFFRGQLLVALFVGVASSIGLWIIGLPFWLLVGMVAGVFNLVPLVGPFIGGEGPFEEGAGNFFAQIWLYAGFAIVGTVLGYWVATALGRDFRSKSLKAYTQARAAKPRRVVRR